MIVCNGSGDEGRKGISLVFFFGILYVIINIDNFLWGWRREIFRGIEILWF